MPSSHASADKSDIGLPDLAARLTFLFKFVPGPDGRLLKSNRQAADLLRKATGIAVSKTYVSQLRTGTRSNPSAVLIGALADLFGVQVTYFFDADIARDIQEKIALASVQGTERIREILTQTNSR